MMHEFPGMTNSSAVSMLLLLCCWSPIVDQVEWLYMFCLRREARIDQKMARREAAKEREGSPEMTRLPGGGDVMGGDDSLAAAKAR